MTIALSTKADAIDGDRGALRVPIVWYGTRAIVLNEYRDLRRLHGLSPARARIVIYRLTVALAPPCE
jgi:hypothetical protein